MTAAAFRPFRIFCLLACLILSRSACAAALPPALEQALASAEIPHSAVAIDIQPLVPGKPVLSLNAKQSMNPASVMKLVTTYAALQRLGPTHTWSTTAYADAEPLDGVLAGNLYLGGGGDPKLTLEAFWLLLRQLRLHGVRDIRGDLVLDRSRYALPAPDPAAFDGAPQRPYNVAPDALLLSYQALRLQFMPHADGKTLVGAEPNFPTLEVINLLEPSGPANGNCGDWKESVRVDFGGTPPNLNVIVTGRYPAACGEQSWLFGLPPGVDYLGGVFRQFWSELGGTLGGSTRSGSVPEGAKPVARQESPPLTEVLRDINKYSNNVMARMLYLSLGAESGARPVRLANAEAALRQFWSGLGLPAA
ncbi:MAG: D-alanyl-D-alanine carboxypeptidase, partial [Rhodocyclaceae bacterium]|nr:D-alanyl-D-alanine carboxypeptidase [Rhodocyclaceae bacterium]